LVSPWLRALERYVLQNAKKYPVKPLIVPYVGQSRAIFELGAVFFSKTVHSEKNCDFDGADGAKLNCCNFGF
jgi:hypothetical protein